jgi:hypothetical protein
MKVGIFNPDEGAYRQIFKRVCKQLGIFFDQDSYQHLIDRWYRQNNRSYQAVHPRDILTILRALCTYEDKPVFLSTQLLDEACEIYFVKR